MKIFLDDIRRCPEGWTLVRNFEEFTYLIAKVFKESSILEIKEISFDHDLSYEHYQAYHSEVDLTKFKFKEKTGYDCACWFISKCLDKGVHPDSLPKFTVHSYNPVGARRIADALLSYTNTWNIVFAQINPFPICPEVNIIPAKP